MSALAERNRHPPFPISNFDSLPEDIFHFVKNRGIAVRGLVFDLNGIAQLFHQFALLARELRGRQHANVIIQVTLAASARVG